MSGRITAAQHAALRDEFDEALAALNAAAVRFDDPDDPLAVRYRAASDALNHASRARESGHKRTTVALDRLEQRIQDLADREGTDAFYTDDEGQTALAGSGGDHAGLLYRLLDDLGWWPDPEPEPEPPTGYVNEDVLVGMLATGLTLSAARIAELSGAHVDDAQAVLDRDDRFTQLPHTDRWTLTTRIHRTSEV